jgi:hypothetical protein
MNPDLRVRIEKYIESLFVLPIPVLTQNVSDADAAGLPAIQVSPNQGKLPLLALEDVRSVARARDWHARRLQHDVAGAALTDGGTITSLELDPKHAEVSRKSLDRAGVGPRVDILVGPANRPCSG